MTEDRMVGWPHQLSEHDEFEQTLGDIKDRETWHPTIHEVAKNWAQLSDRTTINHYFGI